MKRCFKSVAILLVMLLFFTACANNGLKNEGGMVLTDGVNLRNKNYNVDGAVHIHNESPTGKMLISKGVTDYVLVVSQQPSILIENAKKDFSLFFMEATGIAIKSISDSEAHYSDSSKYIVLGENEISREAGVTVDNNTLGAQGFKIITKGNSIFALGATDTGSQWATYELLSKLCGFEYYGADSYALKKDLKEIELISYDITEVPDISMRTPNYGFLMTDKTTMRRMRFNSSDDLFIPVPKNWSGNNIDGIPLSGRNFHNSLNWLPKDMHQKDHPKWYSDDGKNLSYTAHGDEEELALMQQTIIERMKSLLILYPTRTTITITQEDTPSLDPSEACQAIADEYGGAISAVLIMFTNKVAEGIEEWFENEGAEYKRDLQILFFGYGPSVKSPTYYESATDTYRPIDDKVKFHKLVSVYYPELGADYLHGMYDPNSINDEYAGNIKGWAALSERLYYWMYSTNFDHYLVPLNTFNALQENYWHAIINKVDFIYDQAQSTQTGSATGWSLLKIYLYSKLTWNVNQDMELLIENFMKGFYGPAGETMYQLFKDYRTFATYQTAELGFTGTRTVYFNVLQPHLWPKQTLLRWLDCFDTAIEEVETLKQSDYNLYMHYLKNVTVERVAYNYLLIRLYSSSTSNDVLEIRKQQFKHDVTLSPIGVTAEKRTVPVQSVEDVLRSWGLV